MRTILQTSALHVIWHECGIMELIVSPEQELLLRHVTEIREALIRNGISKYAVLVNRMNSYTTSEEVLCHRHHRTASGLYAVAYLVYSEMSERISMSIGKITLGNSVPYRCFYERELAMSWLVDESSKAEQSPQAG